jgi:hypothetical protein
MNKKNPKSECVGAVGCSDLLGVFDSGCGWRTVIEKCKGDEPDDPRFWDRITILDGKRLPTRLDVVEFVQRYEGQKSGAGFYIPVACGEQQSQLKSSPSIRGQENIQSPQSYLIVKLKRTALFSYVIGLLTTWIRSMRNSYQTPNVQSSATATGGGLSNAIMIIEFSCPGQN